jgi:hypothetical protein
MSGSKKGERRGGRKKGTRNKATVEREAKMLNALKDQARATPEKIVIAKDELLAFIPVVKGTVGLFQKAAIDGGQGLPGLPGFNPGKWERFREWAEFFGQLCHKAADFQSPRYRAIAVVVPPGDIAQPNPAPMIEHQPSSELDEERQANAAYLRLVKG